MEALLREATYLVTIISAIVGAIVFAIRARRASMKGLRESIVRAWTNEGDISSHEPIFVTLDLDLKDGDIYGTLSVSTEERLLGAHVGIGWGTATLQVSRFRSRGLQPIATVRLRLSGNRNRLKWKVVKEAEKGVLPAKTLLWPSVVGNRGRP